MPQSIIAMFPAIVSSSSLFPLLGFVLLILCHSSLTGAQNLDQICDTSGSFADNSTYQSNLKLYLSTLPSKGSVSGFLKEAVGEVPDKVYGVSLCRGDANASECRACLDKASLDIQQICPYNKGAMIYYDYCLLRFSSQNFLNSTDNQQVSKYNSSSVTQVARLSQLLHLLLSSATDWAANSTKRFATGEMSNFTSEFPTIYVMVECTPDLSPSDCSQCLQSLFDPLPTDMVGKQGARVLGVRCVIRYELSAFYRIPSMVKLTAPLEDATQLPSDGSEGKKKNAATTALAIAIPAFTALLILSLIYICYWRTRKRIVQSAYETGPELITGVESLLFDLSTLRLATANFSEENRLGEGGFGAVYKGRLPDGREIAVKKLLYAGRGLRELQNELLLVAKLQHRNLVRLLGVCFEDEKMIVYEYVPNRSLDKFLFDPKRSEQLRWGARYRIIRGIAQGLLYLHEESQLKIIHRDLKASNILLDAAMNPKISDFGIAKLFDADQTQDTTKRVVGTFGYMAPEYVKHGKFSVRSDVFSFGILVLEILTGIKNSNSYNSEYRESLLSYTWEKWRGGSVLEMVDPALDGHYQGSDLLRCMQIGLLCVQENPNDRPTMSTVITMLNSGIAFLQAPGRPAFYVEKEEKEDVNVEFSANVARTAIVVCDGESKPLPASSTQVSVTEQQFENLISVSIFVATTSSKSTPTMLPSISSTQFLLFYLILLFVPSRTVAYRWQICSTRGGNFTDNSTYESNLNLLLSSLVSNGSGSGFSTGTLGRIPNRVQGLILCRGDTNATTCGSCLSNGAVDIRQICAYYKDAVVWYDECLIRFSNLQFLSTFDNEPTVALVNYDLKDEVDRFNKVVNELLSSTADWAAYNSTKRYATGQAFNVTQAVPTIYGLAQCTPDMSTSDCRQCLEGVLQGLPQGRMGARNQGVRCNIRFETGPFYEGNPIIRLLSPLTNATTPADNATTPASAPTSHPAVGPTGKEGKTKKTTIAISVSAVSAILLISIFCTWYRRSRKRAAKSPYQTDSEQATQVIESLLFRLPTLRVATANFAEANKLGEGGFGAVYKGLLPDGRVIAVKRLLNSGQGLGELKNELLLVAKLQHRNLVKLLGVCLEEETMIVYEYLPNASLDKFLFDAARGKQLTWGIRYKIICGIARGLLYLHEESQLKIIHRDLKASNILLDADMNPKISDFGLAKLFDIDQTQGTTNRIMGTFGYMAPEYVMRGKFSIKSDVFSFGVLVLEILTGRKSNDSYNPEVTEVLLSYTWEKWQDGSASEIVDPALGGHYQQSDLLRCVQIGLLCVQENPSDRPTMSTIVVMLNSETVSLRAPSQPAFYVGNGDRVVTMSINQVSMSEQESR
uniref:Cysteine-rich receptor-like protein kinase 10 n=1 Tax=Musa acuminata subsp. malaccensis TaxID=214687 RepID=A0A804KIH8_MUSAM